VNLRSLTRGDAAVAAGALLLFVSSFLPLYSFDVPKGVDCASMCNQTVWNSGFLEVLAAVFLTGLGGAALVLRSRFEGEAARTRQIAGLKLGQWGNALAVAALWAALWMLFTSGAGFSAGMKGSTDAAQLHHGPGAYLAFIALLIIAGAAIATPLVPALQARLLPDRPAARGPQQSDPGFQGGYPGGPQQTGGYGYPGAQQGGYGYPQQQWGTPQPGPAQPQDASYGGQPAAAAPAPAPAPDFAPFWFAVPAPRQLAPEDDPAGPPVGELVPGVWFLAVDQRGTALVAQLQDGRRGLLSDTEGIQRG
jgi:hypothetical protein